MATAPKQVKGTRDFMQEELARRQYIMTVVQKHFKLYGFEQIETPAFENLSTLTGKYGEEGEALIFKILNSGDFLDKADAKAMAEGNSSRFANSVSNKALRYDLTIPLARFVAQHRNELVFPFKRFQVAPVWRADRPQKGRYREFYQCDADALGSDSLWQEVEFLNLYEDVFAELGLKVSIHLNNRKLLSALADVFHIQDQLVDFTVALDKLDKIGYEGVQKEMQDRGIAQEVVEALSFLMLNELNQDAKLEKLAELLSNHEEGKEGLAEMTFILDEVKKLNFSFSSVVPDLSLARGLNYYTGSIVEVKALGVESGSIGGGGRYNDLTSLFGFPNLGGVGISFGLDRIYNCLESLNLFSDQVQESSEYLVINFGTDEVSKTYPLIRKLRAEGKIVTLYPEATKFKKQMQYADKKGVRFVVICGEDELKRGVYTLKDMRSGTQEELKL